MFEKGHKIRKGRSYSPSRTAIAWVCGELLGIMFGITKPYIQSVFSRAGKSLSNLNDVASFISSRFKGK